MRTYRFIIPSILLIVIFPQLLYYIMNSPFFDSLSDSAFFLINDILRILGGILGVLVLWNNDFREIFRFKFKSSYVAWFVIIFILQFLWSKGVMTQIIHLYGDDSILSYIPSYTILSAMFFSRVLISNVFIAPFVEEVINRGIVLSLLSKYKKYYVDLILSAIIFSVGHFIYLGWSTIDFLRYFVPGVLIGFYFKKTNCIYYTFVYHLVWNSVPYIFLGWN